MIATLNGTADQNIAYADRLARDPSVVSATSTDDLERSFSFDLMSAVVALIIARRGRAGARRAVHAGEHERV